MTQNKLVKDSLCENDILSIMDWVNSNDIPIEVETAIICGVGAMGLGKIFRMHMDEPVVAGSDKGKFLFNAAGSGLLGALGSKNDAGGLVLATQLAMSSLTSRSNKEPTKSERTYHSKLIDLFDTAFPYFEFVGSEVRPHDDDRDRIDILAKCKVTGRDVIIELKVGNKSAHKQLRSYAHGFKNPILINVSEKEVKIKRDGITYTTFDEIGIHL